MAERGAWWEVGDEDVELGHYLDVVWLGWGWVYSLGFENAMRDDFVL